MRPTLDLDALLTDAREASDLDALIADAIEGVDRDTSRALALTRLRAPGLDQHTAGVVSETLRALDPAPVLRPLLDLAADASLDDVPRIAAFRAISALPPTLVGPIAASEARYAAAVEHLALYEAVIAVHEHPEAVDVVHAMMRQVGTSRLRGFAERLEATRVKAGIPASTLYATALADAAIAADEGARGVMLAAVVAEADPAGSELLQRLRAKAPKKLRAPFQVALLKLETARIGGASRAGGPLRAWCSQPDGQGAVVTFFAVGNPDGTSTVADLCFRLGRDLRQGFVIPRAQERELLELLRDASAETIELSHAPAGELATLVDEALASHRAMGVPIPEECAAPLRVIERVPRAPLPPPPAPTATSSERAAEILKKPRHGAWYFDAYDLADNAKGASRDDVDATLAALGRSPMARRVEGMARYMARFARWTGDAALASEWVGLADDVARDFARSALARAMADASDLGARASIRARVEGYGEEGVLIPFEELFPDVARVETRRLRFEGHPQIPDGEYVMHESYCTDRHCHCERVTFHVDDGARVALRVGHAFSDEAARRFYGERTELDPRTRNLRWAEAMRRELDVRLKADEAWRRDLVRHYEMARSLR